MADKKLAPGEIFIGSYILERLVQLGVKPMFGVPGDFNLTFLDLVEAHPKINWVGCCNELNASYAADGFARVSQVQRTGHGTQGGVKGLGCLLTTFGVGELSAVNGIAGAYAERVPILHIVGVPSTKLQGNRALLHHTLGDGKFNVFETAARGITAAQAFLTSATGAGEEIDRVLRVALTTARPTYLTLPTDLVFSPIPSAPLETPIIPPTRPWSNTSTLPTGEKVGTTQKEEVAFVTAEIERLWNAAKNPVVLVDACAIRYGVTHMVEELVAKTQVKHFSTPMGKSSLEENVNKHFGGVYVGDITDPAVKEAFESADLTILVGSIMSDFNTGEFSYKMPRTAMIELHSNCTKVQYATYPDVSFHTLLPALSAVLQPKEVAATPAHAGLVHKIPAGDANAMVTQEAFWPLWGQFFKENDIIVTETGTSSFGIIDVPFPKGSIAVGQVLWGSIGWAGGSVLGCLKAAEDSKVPRRTILFIGDGSLQLTAQEVATMLRQGLKPIIVVLNNDGYVIERLIHGPEAVYNEISHWKWQELLNVFNHDEIPCKTWLANTRGELETILNDASFAAADKLQLIEVKLGRMDAPHKLVLQAKLSADLNSAL